MTWLALLICTLAALMPWLVPPLPRPLEAGPFPGWPTQLDGRTLRALPLSEREQRVHAGFPGHIARFTDGTHEFILRWVATGTRTLHPAATCLQAVGYTVHTLPGWVDATSRPWGCWRATRGQDQLRVCEQISDPAGQTWTDVSAWYWAALFGTTSGPWWAVTRAEPL